MINISKPVQPDVFHEIARYYDRIMDYVDYDRWMTVCLGLSDLLPHRFVHLDAACGTGVLIKKLHGRGWNSLGVDLSVEMLRASSGKASNGISLRGGLAAADLRTLPFVSSVDFVTCLFDSINFLLDMTDIERAFREVAGALRPEGVFYFDVVTERMVTEHFENQEWTERNGGFSTTWRSTYNRENHVAETYVAVSNGPGGVFRERIYEQNELEDALLRAGLTLLGQYDAHNWKSPNKRTVRIDFVAAKEPSRTLTEQFGRLEQKIRSALPGSR